MNAERRRSVVTKRNNCFNYEEKLIMEALKTPYEKIIEILIKTKQYMVNSK